MDLPRLIWAGETQVFSSQDTDMSLSLSSRPRKQEARPWDRLPLSFLQKNPVDVLIIDASDYHHSRASTLPKIEATPSALRPKVILIAGPSTWTLDPKMNPRRARRKRLEKLGYLSLEWFVSAEQHGSALQQDRLIEVFITPGAGRMIPEPPKAQGLPARPMRNLLLPIHKIPPLSRPPARSVRWENVPTPAVAILQVVGTVRNQALYSSAGVMPDRLDAWVADDDTGVHQLQPEELAKGKGLPSEWRAADVPIPSGVVRDATCLHIWTAVCDTLGSWLKQPQEGAPPTVSHQARPTIFPVTTTPELFQTNHMREGYISVLERTMVLILQWSTARMKPPF
jgi:hypothetical protein